MKSRVDHLKSLSLQEWKLLLASLVLLPVIAFSLQLSGFKRTRKMMSCFLSANGGQRGNEESQSNEAKTIARMVSIAARHGIYRANCLKQSLVLWWLLARRGIGSEIRIGVQKEQAGPFNAHAWVEIGGQPVSDPKSIQNKFKPFELGWD